jgi:hypothetical protein
MATDKVTIEISVALLLAEQKIVRAALAAADHPDHSVARGELKEAASEYRAELKKTGKA